MGGLLEEVELTRATADHNKKNEDHLWGSC